MRAVEKPLNLFALFSLVSSLEVYVLDLSHFKPPFIYEKSAALNMKIQIETRLAFFCS